MPPRKRDYLSKQVGDLTALIGTTTRTRLDGHCASTSTLMTWSYQMVPASACGTIRDVALQDGIAFAPSEGGGVQTLVALDHPIHYGHFYGRTEQAAVPVTCESTHVSSTVLIFTLINGVVSLLGKITTTQPHPPQFQWPFIDNSQTHLERGKITVTEMWYEPSDTDFCCPSTLAKTVWRYNRTRLSAQTTATTPRPVVRERPKDFVGEWHVHGAGLKITSTSQAIENVSHAGPCTTDPPTACYQSMALSLSATGHGRALLATVVGVTYYTEDGTIASPPPDAVPEVGDTFRLEFVFPHLLKATTLHTRDPTQPNALGNPYLCGDDLADEVSYACGA